MLSDGDNGYLIWIFFDDIAKPLIILFDEVGKNIIIHLHHAVYQRSVPHKEPSELLYTS